MVFAIGMSMICTLGILFFTLYVQEFRVEGVKSSDGPQLLVENSISL